MQLYGGGFFDAWLQLMVFYYGAGILLHCVIPRVLPVESVQKNERATSDLLRDCVYSLGMNYFVVTALHDGMFIQSIPDQMTRLWIST